MLVKYEDLIEDPEKIFISVVKFIKKLTNSNYTLDNTKLKNTLYTTTFDYLQNLEKTNSFNESSSTKKGEIKFFKYGSKNDGKENVPDDLRNKIEKDLKFEMRELNYL